MSEKTYRYYIPQENVDVLNSLEDAGEIKKRLLEHLSHLNRTELMDFYDAIEGMGMNERVRECASAAYYEYEWKYTWPMGEDTYKEVIPDIIRSEIPISYKMPRKDGKNIKLDLNELEKQVNGIQKKLDKIVKLLENFEITMNARQALEM